MKKTSLTDELTGILNHFTKKDPQEIIDESLQEKYVKPQKDGGELRDRINRVRRFRGKGRGNLSRFILEDREKRS